MKKLEFNREFNYEHKKRLTEQGIKEWIEFPNSFFSKERRVLEFLNNEDIKAILN